MSAPGPPVIISRKHWITFILPAALLLTGCLLVVFTSHALRYSGILCLLSGLYKLYGNLTVKWQLLPNELQISSSTFLWKIKKTNIPLCAVCNISATSGVFLRYATLTLQQVSTERPVITASGMTNSSTFCKQVNEASLLHKNQAACRQHIGKELTRILELKKQGLLSPDEFEKMRARILNQV